MSDTQSLQKKLDELISFIDQSINTAHQGQNPDLGNLDHRVADLCRDLQLAPADVAKPMQADMARMISKLDELEMIITDLKNKVQENK